MEPDFFLVLQLFDLLCVVHQAHLLETQTRSPLVQLLVLLVALKFERGRWWTHTRSIEEVVQLQVRKSYFFVKVVNLVQVLFAVLLLGLGPFFALDAKSALLAKVYGISKILQLKMVAFWPYKTRQSVLATILDNLPPRSSSSTLASREEVVFRKLSFRFIFWIFSSSRMSS